MLRDRVGDIRISAIDILVFLDAYQRRRAHSSSTKDTIQHLERGIASSELFGEQVPSSLHPNPPGLSFSQVERRDIRRKFSSVFMTIARDLP